ncbi:Uma2 family endonuclease [Actinomadura kijaniata]|uniref:Uma2 family endonuclease n=1 Tax=Actinomadura kijaniata TaxID=46161 RepID=UPI002480CE51|nr:Uma2 family endonuclease [Actinomadura kijaniata]
MLGVTPLGRATPAGRLEATTVSEHALSLGNHDDGALDLRSYAEQLLETHKVEYVDEGVLLVMAPAGFEHRSIIESIVDAIKGAFYTSQTTTNWATHSENFQWDLPDQSGRFYIPDLVVTRRDAHTAQEEREGIALVVEVTSPKSPDTVLNDRETKPKQYAKAGIPLYLLIDQELRTWTLHALADGWIRYQIAADGRYGEKIFLPEPFGFSIPTGDWPEYGSF